MRDQAVNFPFAMLFDALFASLIGGVILTHGEAILTNTGNTQRLLALFLVVLLSSLCALTAAAADEFRFHVERIVVQGDNPFTDQRTATLLAPFAQREHSVKTLLETAQTLESTLRSAGYGFHRVILPPQTLNSGEVRLEVVAFRLGGIEVEPNDNFNAANLRASLPPLAVGETVNINELRRALYFANRHPFKDVDVLFRQGEKEREVEARIAARTRDPRNVYLMLNNTGTKETGRSRLTALYQDTNLWSQDHEVLASFTTSPENVSDVLQFGLNYAWPIYAWRGRLEGFAFYSNVDSGRVADFDIAGAGTVWGLTYSQNLPGTQHYGHDLKLGVTDKLFDNDVRFQGIQLVPDVRSRPLGLQYAGEYMRDGTEIRFNLQWNHNLSGGSHNRQADYSASRAGAPQNWQALRFYGRLEQSLAKRFLLRARLNAQYSTDPLIAGEQIGLGGVYSIRGYEERELAGDSGYTATLELWWPGLWKGLSPYAFIDWGERDLEEPAKGEEGRKRLASLGLGADWRDGKPLSVTVDLAYALDTAVQTDRGDLRIDLNLIYRH